jgi:tetratricopeptide (TPR) repeat protein
MKRTLIGAAVILGVVAMSAATWANGGGSGGGGSSAGSGNSGNSSGGSQVNLYQQAKKLIDDEQYTKAIPLLQKSIQQKGEYADALNLLGYSNRKLGDMAKAMTYYTKALNKEPKHLGANEYMGELYLELNNLPKAEERLAVLKGACGNCEQFEELDDKVKDYKKAHGIT